MERIMAANLEVLAGDALRQAGLTIAIGESCTGGLLSDMLTNVPGSSDYFMGGITAYAYEAKERLLGVAHDTLYQYGAVSSQVALAMAHGARIALGTDIGLAVTGIAGPSGGLPDKPVGLTWVAVTSRTGERAEEHLWGGDRLENKRLSAQAALRLLLEFLNED